MCRQWGSWLQRHSRASSFQPASSAQQAPQQHSGRRQRLPSYSRQDISSRRMCSPEPCHGVSATRRQRRRPHRHGRCQPRRHLGLEAFLPPQPPADRQQPAAHTGCRRQCTLMRSPPGCSSSGLAGRRRCGPESCATINGVGTQSSRRRRSCANGNGACGSACNPSGGVRLAAWPGTNAAAAASASAGLDPSAFGVAYSGGNGI